MLREGEQKGKIQGDKFQFKSVSSPAKAASSVWSTVTCGKLGRAYLTNTKN
jgi:hypothetical protein